MGPVVCSEDELLFQLIEDINDNGKPANQDFADQADMCEIVRALVASDKFPNISDVTKIDIAEILKLMCVGTSTGSRICAINANGYAEKTSWVIPLEPMNIKVFDKPQFVKK